MCSLLRFLLAAVLMLLAAGCERGTGTATVKRDRLALRKVVLQTDWFPQAEHGGFYQALVNGYYVQAGLDVKILPGGPGAGIKLKVLKGEADFGMNRSDDLFVAASQGMPVVMVAATMQHDPMALMVHAKSRVKTFNDLDGRVVIGNVGMAYMPFLERKFGVHFEKRQNTYGLGEFLANADLIQQCMVTNEPFFAQQQGRPVRTLLLADAGYDCYHAIFCRRELVRSSPEVVRAFVQASIRGWRDYLEGDPGMANAQILARNPQMTPELLQFSRSEMILRRLVQGDRIAGEDVGQLSLARLSDQMEILLSLQIIPAAVPVTSVATKDFLPPPPPLTRP